MRRISDARSSGRTRLQDSNACVADAIAFPASAIVASGKRPITCRKSQGLTDSKCFVAETALPPIRFFPCSGSRFWTRARAARKALRSRSAEKSDIGSFRNSGTTATSGRAIYQRRNVE